MADKTKIEWTEATWNPITGCTVISPGCTNCYAMKLAGTRMKNHESREGLTTDSKAGPVWNGKVRLNEEWLVHPLQWRRPRMIFACAHGDLFHESVPDEWIDRVFAVMALSPQHTFQVLTKRSTRMREYLNHRKACAPIFVSLGDGTLTQHPFNNELEPPRNIWLGVSVEDQPRADERVADLRETSAAIRWLSCEPLLEEVLFDPCDLAALDWVVVGGESGPGARPMHPDWARSLRDQCSIAGGVPFFFKQWGNWAPICEMSDEAIDACYHPAPDHSPEASRRLKVDQCVLHRDGQRFIGNAMFYRPAFEQGSGAMTMMAIGKKAAGRTLDGQLHDAMPVRP